MRGGVPLGHELVGRQAQHPADRLVHAAHASGGAQQLRDVVVAVGAAHVGQQRLSIAVGEVPRILQLAVARERVADGVLDGAPHPHRGQRRDRAERQVLGHALDEPQRHRGRRGVFRAAAGRTGHVVLKGVRELVADDVVQIAQRPAGRQHDPAAQGLGDAASSLAQALDHVGLLELGLGGVHDERLPAGQLMVQDGAQASVPALRHPTCEAGGDLLFGVVVDVKVRGPQNSEVEALVLDLVVSEVLGVSGRGEAGRRETHHHESRHAGGE